MRRGTCFLLTVGVALLAFALVPTTSVAQTGVLYVQNNNVGIGTDTPVAKLQVIPDTAGAVVGLFQQGTLAVERTDGLYANIRFATTGGTVTQSWLFQNNPNNGEFVIRDQTGAVDPLRVKRGAPTNSLVMTSAGVGIGTGTPAATLDVNGSIYQRGSLLHADYVFENDYQLPSIAEHSKLMWSERHLPAVPARQVDNAGYEIVDVGAQRRGILEELETAHIYIDQLHEALSQSSGEVESLRRDVNDRDEMLKKLEARVAKLESMMASASHE